MKKLKTHKRKLKASKYEITLKVLLSKYKENAEREFAPVYFNSAAKTVIGRS